MSHGARGTPLLALLHLKAAAFARAIALGGAVWLLAVLTAGAQSSPSSGPRSTNDRVFTASQAERGKVLFADVCSACHPDPLWRPTWEGKPLGDLYTKIIKFMPDDNPGTLTPAEALSSVAYILQANGAPAGELPLTEDLTVLNRIRVDPAPAQTP